jgi:hypothetical protein
LNGDTEETLMRGLEESHHVLNQALEVMRMMAPNGRNYYPIGAQAYGEATDQYRAMCQRIHDTQAEIHAIMEGILDRKDYVDNPLKGK